MKRRKFIEFLGKGTLVIPMVPSVLASCNLSGGGIDSSKFPSIEDDLILADGLEYDVLVKWGDPISKDHFFGYNNDYIAFLPDGKDEGVLWVNHEYVDPKFVSGYTSDIARTRKQITREMYEVGGSVIRIKKSGSGWRIVPDHVINKRITGASGIPFEWSEPIARQRAAMGTIANCSGGVTPWGTVLTCEENYDLFYGDYDFATGRYFPSKLQWESFFPRNRPEHYGWIVEVDPTTGESKKHIAMGRMAHECATVAELQDGRVVVYSGDDQNDGCLYKYVSDEPDKLSPGKLYVGNFDAGEWVLIDMNSPFLEGKFDNETELKVRTREAALLVGGTQLDRPEDIEIDPQTGDVIVALTNNKPKNNFHGSIMRLKEEDGYAGTRFSNETYLTGGEETGFSCPDNMAFDTAGNLWFTSDISGESMGEDPYKSFGNNGLFVVLRNGEDAGKVFQVASAPKDAELTGPCFTSDGKTLFLSVQHPGETSPDLENLTSNWPGGGTTIPRSAVVTITGSLLESLQQSV